MVGALSNRSGFEGPELELGHLDQIGHVQVVPVDRPALAALDGADDGLFVIVGISLEGDHRKSVGSVSGGQGGKDLAEEGQHRARADAPVLHGKPGREVVVFMEVNVRLLGQG